MVLRIPLCRSTVWQCYSKAKVDLEVLVPRRGTRIVLVLPVAATEPAVDMIKEVTA